MSAGSDIRYKDTSDIQLWAWFMYGLLAFWQTLSQASFHAAADVMVIKVVNLGHWKTANGLQFFL